jgi:predicted RNA binding protein YcfA (HicA-like mRNA interferase family)
MPPLRAIKSLELIRLFKQLGFEGPFSGGKHQYMVKENLKVWIPNPNQRDISPALLVQILRQAEISREEWEEL